MKKKIKDFINKFIRIFLTDYFKKLENIEIQNGRILECLLSNKDIKYLEETEFKVFSQCGEDGIINYLVNQIDIKSNFFIEFGFDNFNESSTRFLMMNKNWSGLIIDKGEENLEYVKSTYYFWKFDLNVINSFITVENINELLLKNLPAKCNHVGLIQVDIDGNDYWVFNAINSISTDILIIEYNSLWGMEKKVTIPYNSNFYRYDYSNNGSYYGASLPAIIDLAEKKGYSFIGTNSAGNNAFFVLKKHYLKFKHLQVKMNISNFRQPSLIVGEKLKKLTECLNGIKDLRLIDLEDDKEKKIKDLYSL